MEWFHHRYLEGEVQQHGRDGRAIFTCVGRRLCAVIFSHAHALDQRSPAHTHRSGREEHQPRNAAKTFLTAAGGEPCDGIPTDYIRGSTATGLQTERESSKEFPWGDTGIGVVSARHGVNEAVGATAAYGADEMQRVVLAQALSLLKALVSSHSQVWDFARSTHSTPRNSSPK